MNAVKATALEETEAWLANMPRNALLINNVDGERLLHRLVDEAKRHASRADTAMRRVVELEAEVVRLEEAERSR